MTALPGLVTLLKAVHVPALVVWCGCLLYLPGVLIAWRRAERSPDRLRIGRASRFLHNAIMSPASFIAIATGTALMFASPALDGWMFLKLALVLVMVAAHLQLGALLRRMSEYGRMPPLWRIAVLFGAVMAAIAGILLLVLGEPAIPTGWLPGWLLEPGAAQRFTSCDTPIPLSKTS